MALAEGVGGGSVSMGRTSCRNAKAPVILGTVHAVASTGQRGRGLDANEALAVAHLRAYGYDRRAVIHGRVACYEQRPGRPGPNHPTRFDARIVRVIDFGRALASIGSDFSTILQLYHCDGESITDICRAVGYSPRKLWARLPEARQALVRALSEANLL